MSRRFPGWLVCCALFLSLLVGSDLTAAAQEDVAKYPSKPITLIVIFGAGGPTDVPARENAAAVGKEINQGGSRRKQDGRRRSDRAHRGRAGEAGRVYAGHVLVQPYGDRAACAFRSL